MGEGTGGCGRPPHLRHLTGPSVPTGSDRQGLLPGCPTEPKAPSLFLMSSVVFSSPCLGIQNARESEMEAETESGGGT